MKIDSSVICAECRDTGTIVTLADGNHLTCALCNDKPIWGSKPKWCPKEDGQMTLNFGTRKDK